MKRITSWNFLSEGSLAKFYGRYAVGILLLVACGLPVLGHGVRGALQRPNNDVRQWLPAGFEETEQYDWFLSHFGSEEMAVVSWPGATVDDSRLDRVVAGLQPYVEETSATAVAGDSPRYFKQVTSTRDVLAQLTAPPVKLPRKHALRRLEGLLVGTNGQTGAVLVMVNDQGAKHRHEALAIVDQVVAAEAGVPRESVHIGGPTVDSAALDSESQRSRYLLSAISVGLALVLAWRCLRNVRLVAMVFATAILAAANAIAIVYYAGDRMNLLLVMMPTLVYLTAMSGAIHLVNYYRESLERLDAKTAPAAAVKMGLLPGVLCTVTTAIGLGSLGTSEVVPVRQFGTYSAMGVLAALPLLYLVLPSLLRLWPIAGPHAQRHRFDGMSHSGQSPALGFADSWIEKLAGWIARRHAWVFAGGLTALSLGALGVTQLTTSVKLLNLFSPESRIIRDYTWLERELGPLVPIEVVLQFPAASSLNMLERLELVQQVERRLGEIEKVGGTMSAATFAPPLPQGHSTRQIIKRVVFDRRLQENRDYFAATNYLRPSGDAELWRVSARVEALNSLDYGQYMKTIRAAVEPLLDETAAAGQGEVTATYTGIVPLVYKAQRTLLEDLLSSFFSAFVIIGIMMVALLRNAWAGLASMIPNLFPAVMVFGTMGAAGVLCDIGSMMTAGVALGIAVDDTIHYLSWFRRGLDQGLSRHQALVLAYRRCAVPMIQSSIICGLGLLVFAFSNFIPTARFAWLMAAMLGSALVGDLLILPAMLAGPVGRAFERRREAARETIAAEPIPAIPAELVPA